MTDFFRLWFIAVYGVLLVLLVAEIIRFRKRRFLVDKQFGTLPPIPAIVNYLSPPILLTFEIGMITEDWLPLRIAGFVLSVCAVALGVWANRTLGEAFAPGSAILRDQVLVEDGPFRFVRHPIYSAVITLWLGAALGTLNWILLVAWPLLVLALFKVSEEEEKLLREKFGSSYVVFARQRGRLLPRLGRRVPVTNG